MAASDFHFYEDTFNTLSGSLDTYITDVATNIIDAITPVATTLVTIYIMLWGWSMMRGVISEPITDGTTRILKLATIIAIALNLGRYNGFLSDMLWNSPDALAAYIADGYEDSTNNMQFLDSLMSKIYDMGDAYWQKAYAGAGALGIPNFGLLIVAILIWAGGILATGYAAFLLALSKMALAIILGVGPLFILMTIFEPTKRFFDTWIGQALNYVFLVMLTAAAIKLIVTIIEIYLLSPGGAAALAEPSIDLALPVMVLCAIASLVMMQLPSVASALGGGVAIGTLGAVGWAFGKAKGGLSAMRPTNLRRSLNKARADVRIASNAGRAVVGAPQAVYRRITGGGRNKIARG
ncbi:Conjugal transfer protein [Candidatus Methylobacter favarea]|uniref:Conjugal transfer protein n=1 Tax=Candidatus Methylobacter favarea TaxID=2707345 RepID=A0A8S0WAI5_9GAMM|nr:type IV secretion system protein [Candidatus Methylobacter favarea]CAA9890769.1 Conjugal transfer protein [Candidatus Methylobacter favarea]